MSANTILTSIVTAGVNSHTTSAEEANVLATDFVTQGVVGAITLNTGSGGTGSFCVNQNTGSDMAIIIKAGQAYIAATPSSQGAQVLRARAAADYTAFSISSNASGSTKYDWVYLKVDPTKANAPASDASDVTSIVVSRSSSNTTDNGTPPTYGVNLAIITIANGATAITNSLITDKRVNASVGAQNGSLIVTQASTGTNAIIQAAGVDSNVSLNLSPKGTGNVLIGGNTITSGAWTSFSPTWSGLTVGNGTVTAKYAQIGKVVIFKVLLVWGSTTSCTTPITMTLPVAAKEILGVGNNIGTSKAYDLTSQWDGPLPLATASTVVFRWYQVSGSGIKDANITNASPNTWTTSSEFHMEGRFEAA